MNRIMLDLETMGNGSNAAIVSIGAVRFDVFEGITDRFHMGVDLESVVAGGGVMDASTVQWWMTQSSDAQAELLALEKVHIAGVLMEFQAWAWKDGIPDIDEMWVNGATADNVWLANTYRRHDRTPPWSYRADRCYRTMRAMFPEVVEPEFVGVKHNALNDAEHQALHLIEILKYVQRITA